MEVALKEAQQMKEKVLKDAKVRKKKLKKIQNGYIFQEFSCFVTFCVEKFEKVEFFFDMNDISCVIA